MHDMQDQSPGQSTPAICHVCEIAILPGTDHTTPIGHFMALKEFVKLLQDDLEQTRMQDFQHPTRDELWQAMVEMEEQFNKLAYYSETLAEHIKKLLHAKV
jgi:hypothetical protein